MAALSKNVEIGAMPPSLPEWMPLIAWEDIDQNAFCDIFKFLSVAESDTKKALASSWHSGSSFQPVRIAALTEVRIALSAEDFKKHINVIRGTYRGDGFVFLDRKNFRIFTNPAKEGRLAPWKIVAADGNTNSVWLSLRPASGSVNNTHFPMQNWFFHDNYLWDGFEGILRVGMSSIIYNIYVKQKPQWNRSVWGGNTVAAEDIKYGLRMFATNHPVHGWGLMASVGDPRFGVEVKELTSTSECEYQHVSVMMK